MAVADGGGEGGRRLDIEEMEGSLSYEVGYGCDSLGFAITMNCFETEGEIAMVKCFSTMVISIEVSEAFYGESC